MVSSREDITDKRALWVYGHKSFRFLFTISYCSSYLVMRFNVAHFFTTLIVLPSLVLGFGFRDRSLGIRGTTNLQRRSWTPSHVGHGTLFPRVADGTDIKDLEAAALGFIKLMQSIEGGKYKEREVLVIGGQAMAHYYPEYRSTDVTAGPGVALFAGRAY